MIYQEQRITIVKINKPSQLNINQKLQWLGNSLGLFNLRDKNKSCFRIFIEFLKNAKNNTAVTSDEIAEKLDLSRGTVVHHINRLMEAGILSHTKNKYYLRVNNLNYLIDEIEKDVTRTMNDLKNVAKEIDETLGL
jgi:predicted transcriptional regulator